MGAKSLYLDNRQKYKEEIKLTNNLKAIKDIERGLDRFNKYKSFWQVVDLDELVKKLFKNPIYENSGQKFTITDLESNYIIYCDNGGNYFRIGDKRVNCNYVGHYLDINLQSVLNEVKEGRVSGMEKGERYSITHFKMLIKKKGSNNL